MIATEAKHFNPSIKKISVQITCTTVIVNALDAGDVGILPSRKGSSQNEGSSPHLSQLRFQTSCVVFVKCISCDLGDL